MCWSMSTVSRGTLDGAVIRAAEAGHAQGAAHGDPIVTRGERPLRQSGDEPDNGRIGCAAPHELPGRYKLPFAHVRRVAVGKTAHRHASARILLRVVVDGIVHGVVVLLVQYDRTRCGNQHNRGRGGRHRTGGRGSTRKGELAGCRKSRAGRGQEKWNGDKWQQKKRDRGTPTSRGMALENGCELKGREEEGEAQNQ